ncbi:MAG: type I polyketide synthase, partial [Pseudonocardiaceae bacterium]
MTQYLELGPDGILTSLVQECLDNSDSEKVTAVAALRRERHEIRTLFTTLGTLHTHGTSPDWPTLFAGTGARHVDLPTYAFQHQRYWLNIQATREPDEAEARFWQLIESEDLEALTETLAIKDSAGRSSLNALLPALSSWRRQHRELSQVTGWQYRITWQPVNSVAHAALSGRWIVVTPTGDPDHDWHDAVIDALTRSGAEVHRVVVPEDSVDRESLRNTLSDALLNGPEPGGVVSLLAFDELAHPQWNAVPTGLVGTLVLIQALTGMGIRAPLWCATRGAVAVNPAEPLDCPGQASVWGLSRIAGLEYPDWRGGVVDLPEEPTEAVLAALVGVVGGVGECEVAVRPGGVFGRR